MSTTLKTHVFVGPFTVTLGKEDGVKHNQGKIEKRGAKQHESNGRKQAVETPSHSRTGENGTNTIKGRKRKRRLMRRPRTPNRIPSWVGTTKRKRGAEQVGEASSQEQSNHTRRNKQDETPKTDQTKPEVIKQQ